MQRIATEAGMSVWLTGGAMRDMLRGARIVDLDFTVERDAIKLAKALAQACGGEVLVGRRLKRGVELELPGGVRASVIQRPHREVLEARRQTADRARQHS